MWSMCKRLNRRSFACRAMALRMLFDVMVPRRTTLMRQREIWFWPIASAGAVLLRLRTTACPRSNGNLRRGAGSCSVLLLSTSQGCFRVGYAESLTLARLGTTTAGVDAAWLRYTEE